MVGEALRNSPELRQLDALIAAGERQLHGVRRSMFIPTVLLDGDLSYFDGWGEGSDFGLEIPGIASAEGPDSINWTLQLVASLPLFTGLQRRSAEQRIDEELAELYTQRAAVAERIEESTRQTLHLSGASAAGIGLAQDAAEAARNNLELVRDSYARGVASIPELIDAQTSERVAAVQAANAVYDYQIDITRVERAAGFFEWEITEEEQVEFYQRVEAYFEAHEAP